MGDTSVSGTHCGIYGRAVAVCALIIVWGAL